MKKVLIISEFFAPQNTVGAIRLTKIAKYLHRFHNCEITVITRNKNFEIIDSLLVSDAEIIKSFIKVSEGSILSNINNTLGKRRRLKDKNSGSISKDTETIQSKFNFKQKLFLYMRFCLNLLNNLSYSLQACKKLKGSYHDYDVIISSYGPYSSHYIGRYLKKKNPLAFWIADFRDAVFSPETPFGFRYFSKSFAKRICKHADAITAVSKGTIDSLFIQKCNKSHIITNGYDKDDLSTTLLSKDKKKKLKFVYVGNLYSGKRDLSVVFKAVRELVNGNLIELNKIEFIYAGNSGEVFNSQIKQYGLIDCAVIHESVPREKSIEIQLNSDILLLSSWNETGSTGIITGKFLEYMMMDKPIVCSVSGNLPNSTLKQMISEAEIGICYEEANDELDYQLLKKFIYQKYAEFINEENLKFNPNHKYIEGFDYKNITNQFNNLFENK